LLQATSLPFIVAATAIGQDLGLIDAAGVAALVGVGRGTDLVLYALCVAFLFVTIALYLRLNEMHDRYVELARRLALHEALHDTPHEPVPVAGRHSSDPY
jgi:hypothetical protein